MTDRNVLLDQERKAFREDPNYNWADFQEIVTLTGGDKFSPAVKRYPWSPGDNMAFYGFRPADDYETFSVLDDEWKLPTFSGVYAVTSVYHGRFNDDGTTVGYMHLLYIGCAQDIAKRMLDRKHWYNRAKEREPRDVHVQLWVIPTTDYRRIERDLIRRMRPLFNIHHRNG